jgi:peroxiredoxin Q/BCP
MALTLGDRVPDFSLPEQNGGPVRFADLLGKGPVVLFFYPKDETPGCTREACSFRDAHDELRQAGAVVYGVSGDSVESHASFAKHHKLQYGLLADVGDKVRNDVFGVPRAFLGLAPGRVTFVVDGAGVIRHKHNSSLDMQSHVDEALAVVKKIATGEAAK